MPGSLLSSWMSLYTDSVVGIPWFNLTPLIPLMQETSSTSFGEGEVVI